MERIQSAIEKARAARQRKQAEDPARPLAPGVAATALAARAEPQEVDPWAAIAEFKPDLAALEAYRVVAYQSGPSAIPFDVMRTKLLHRLRASNWKRVALTSPGSGCGKTMMTLNLAFSLARQRDIRILVVDLDLRRPSLGPVLGLKAKANFAAALQGTAVPEDHMVRYGPNLVFAITQVPARNPAELLQGAGAAAVLDAIEERYKPDVILFDLPPMLVNDDTFAFADQIDCALLVAAAEKTRIEEIERCEQELAARVQVLGVVLNKCRYLDKGENYYGYES